jgi:hypothetical protein
MRKTLGEGAFAQCAYFLAQIVQQFGREALAQPFRWA